MTIIQIPEFGSNDEGLEHIKAMVESAPVTHAEVPLTIYVDGKRHVIGTATVQGDRVSAVLGDDISGEVMDLIAGRPEEAMFSLGFSGGPDPYQQRPRANVYLKLLEERIGEKLLQELKKMDDTAKE